MIEINKKLEDFLPKKDDTFFKEFEKINITKKISKDEVIEKRKIKKGNDKK